MQDSVPALKHSHKKKLHTRSPLQSSRRVPRLFLLSTLQIGGSEKKTIKIANALHHRGHDVHVAYLNSPDTLLGDLDKEIPVTCLYRKGRFSLQALTRLCRYVEGQRISQIICVNLYPLLYAVGVRRLVTHRRVFCAVLVNTTEFWSTKEKLQMALYAPLLRRADSIVFGCKHQLGLWTKQYRLPRTKCNYIYNGVDTAWFSMNAIEGQHARLRTDLGLRAKHFIVGTVGALRPEKRHKDFLTAIDRLSRDDSRVRAVIVGDGPERVGLEKFAQQRSLTNKVLFLGQVEDVRPALAVMDVFVLPSIAVETFSNAALEAMSMSKPVILSNISGAHEMVSNGENGFLYQKGNIDELVVLLRKLLRDKELRRNSGQAARRIALHRFAFLRMVDDYERIFLHQ